MFHSCPVISVPHLLATDRDLVYRCAEPSLQIKLGGHALCVL